MNEIALAARGFNVCCLLACALGLLIMFNYYNEEYVPNRNMIATNCTVENANIVLNNDTKLLRSSFAAYWNVHYKLDKKLQHARIEQWFNSAQDARSYLSVYKVNSTIPCYYCNANKTHVQLQLMQSSVSLSVGLVSLLIGILSCVACTALCLLFTVQKSKQNTEVLNSAPQIIVV